MLSSMESVSLSKRELSDTLGVIDKELKSFTITYRNLDEIVPAIEVPHFSGDVAGKVLDATLSSNGLRIYDLSIRRGASPAAFSVSFLVEDSDWQENVVQTILSLQEWLKATCASLEIHGVGDLVTGLDALLEELVSQQATPSFLKLVGEDRFDASSLKFQLPEFIRGIHLERSRKIHDARVASLIQAHGGSISQYTSMSWSFPSSGLAYLSLIGGDNVSTAEIAKLHDLEWLDLRRCTFETGDLGDYQLDSAKERQQLRFLALGNDATWYSSFTDVFQEGSSKRLDLRKSAMSAARAMERSGVKTDRLYFDGAAFVDNRHSYEQSSSEVVLGLLSQAPRAIVLRSIPDLDELAVFIVEELDSADSIEYLTLVHLWGTNVQLPMSAELNVQEGSRTQLEAEELEFLERIQALSSNNLELGIRTAKGLTKLFSLELSSVTEVSVRLRSYKESTKPSATDLDLYQAIDQTLRDDRRKRTFLNSIETFSLVFQNRTEKEYLDSILSSLTSLPNLRALKLGTLGVPLPSQSFSPEFRLRSKLGPRLALLQIDDLSGVSVLKEAVQRRSAASSTPPQSALRVTTWRNGPPFDVTISPSGSIVSNQR